MVFIYTVCVWDDEFQKYPHCGYDDKKLWYILIHKILVKKIKQWSFNCFFCIDNLKTIFDNAMKFLDEHSKDIMRDGDAYILNNWNELNFKKLTMFGDKFTAKVIVDTVENSKAIHHAWASQKFKHLFH